MNKKIDRLKELYYAQCQTTGSTSRICDITVFRIEQIQKQISLFLEREETRKAQAVIQQKNEIIKQEVIDLTNAERTKIGLPVLRYNSLLETSAQGHAEDMIRRDYFDHTSPEGDEPVDRINKSGYLIPYYECNCTKSYTVGENIADGQDSAAQVVQDWMDSLHHRENILNPEFTEIGIGYQGNTWVQNFGNISLVK